VPGALRAGRQFYFMQRTATRKHSTIISCQPARPHPTKQWRVFNEDPIAPRTPPAEVPRQLLEAYLTAIRSVSRLLEARPALLPPAGRLPSCRRRLLRRSGPPAGRRRAGRVYWPGESSPVPDFYWDRMAEGVESSDAVSSDVKFQVRTCRLVRQAATQAVSGEAAAASCGSMLLDYHRLLAAHRRGLRFLLNAAPRSSLRLLRHVLRRLKPAPAAADLAGWPWPEDNLLQEERQRLLGEHPDAGARVRRRRLGLRTRHDDDAEDADDAGRRAATTRPRRSTQEVEAATPGESADDLRLLYTYQPAEVASLEGGGGSSGGFSEDLAVLGSCVLLLAAGRLPPQFVGGGGGGGRHHQQATAANYCIDFARLLMLAAADRDSAATAAASGAGSGLLAQKSPSHADLWARVGRFFVTLGGGKRTPSWSPGANGGASAGSRPSWASLVAACTACCAASAPSSTSNLPALALLLSAAVAGPAASPPAHRASSGRDPASSWRAAGTPQFRLQPANPSWLLTRADLAYAEREPSLALRCYLEAAMPLPNCSNGPCRFNCLATMLCAGWRAAASCLGMRSCAGIFGPVCARPGHLAVRLLSDRPWRPDLSDCTLPYLWDLSLLEILTVSSARRGALAKRDKFYQLHHVMQLSPPYDEWTTAPRLRSVQLAAPALLPGRPLVRSLLGSAQITICQFEFAPTSASSWLDPRGGANQGSEGGRQQS
uniref:RING-type E3 ubiquitin transferase n=1 Tax=Macrostomum lignano TaxID=282301 RepID=A0A1I8FLP0_9PLAT